MAIDAAMDFQTEMTKLNTLIGISADEVESLNAQLLDLAPSVGRAPEDLSRAMFAIQSGGARGAEAMETLEQSAKASAIGLGNMTDIGRTATAALQAFGDQGLTATEAIDVMVATVRAGNLEASELAPALGKVMGQAAAMGVTFQEVGSFVATFTRLGVNARVATTSLRATLAAILKPTDDTRRAMRQLGTSVDEVRERIAGGGLTETLIELIQAAEGNQDTIGNLIPNVRALAGVLGTAGVQSEAFAQVTEDINNSLGLTNEGFETFSEQAQAAFDRFGAAVDAAQIKLGARFLPTVTTLVNFIANNADRAFRGLAALISGALASSFVILATNVNIAAGAVRGLAGAFALVGGWPGLIIAAGTALATYFITRTKEAQEEVDKLDEKMDDLGNISGQSTEKLIQLKSDLEETIELRRQAWLQGTTKSSDIRMLEREEKRLAAINQELHERQRLDDDPGLDEPPPAPDTSEFDAFIAQLKQTQNELLLTERQLFELKLEGMDLTKTQKDEARAIFRTTQRIKEQREALEKAKRAREEAQQSFAQTMTDLEETIQNIRDQQFQRELAEWEQAMEKLERASDRMAGQLTDALLEIDGTLDSVVDSVSEAVTRILQEMARLAIQEAITKPLTGMFLSFLSGAFGPGAAPQQGSGSTTMPTLGIERDVFAGASLGGGNAFGGSVAGGQATVVGERGRELFLPAVDGEIIPLQGGGGTTVIVEQHIPFDVSMIDSRSGRDFIRQHGGDIARIVGDAARRSTAFKRSLSGGR